MSIRDLDTLKEIAALAQRRSDLLSEANALKSSIVSRLSNVALEDYADEPNPDKIISSLYRETLDDNGQAYEGFEALSLAICTKFLDRPEGKLFDAVYKQIINDRWYSSNEYQAEQDAYDENVFGRH